MIWNIDGDVPNAIELLGFIPSFLHEDDTRPAAEQIAENYSHGGGWRPMAGWTLDLSDGGAIAYADDPPLRPIAHAKLRDEMIIVYPHGWVAIVQRNGAFEISRMD